MALTATLPQQPIIVDSFWNLIQSSDESVQKELFIRLQSKYLTKRNAKALSDLELEGLLADYVPVTEFDFPDVTRDQYINYAHMRTGIL